MMNEYSELEATASNSNREEDNKTRCYLEEIKSLQEDKNTLYKYNITLQLRAEKLEKLENEVKNRYILKSEYEKRIQIVENDREYFRNKYQEMLMSLEKEKREKCNLKIEHAELQKALQEQNKMYETYCNSANIMNAYRTEEPYDVHLSSQSDLDIDLNYRSVCKLRQSGVAEELDPTPENMNTLSKFIRQETIFDDKKVSLKVTPLDMNKVYKQSKTIHDARLSRRNEVKQTERLSLRQTILNENKDEIYREFFRLTYQSFKLNSENIEPFLSVKFNNIA